MAFNDGNGRPDGMQPEYRDAEAMQQAEREEDEADEEEQAPHERSRYVLDEADEDEDDGDDDDDDDNDDEAGFYEALKKVFCQSFFLKCAMKINKPTTSMIKKRAKIGRVWLPT